MKKFPGRLGLQQRVFPAYRATFFDLLAASTDGLSLFAGQPRPDESIHTATELDIAQYYPARNRHFLRGPLYLCWQPNQLAWLEQWDPAALILEANPRYPSNRAAVRWMHARDRPVIGWGLGAPPLNGLLRYPRRRSRIKFLRSLDAVIAYSSRGADDYRALGLRPDRIYVAHNAVAPRPVDASPKRSPAFDGQPNLLFVGRLQRRKRIDNLLRACSALPPDLTPRLNIVGDGPARADLEALAAELFPQAEFLGARHGPELVRSYASADLFVLPGTGGLAIQEAMSHGLPVVVAEGDGTQADLVRPDNGWLVPPHNLAALTQALIAALSDPVRLRVMGAESYRIALEEINIETMTSVFLSVLHILTRKD
ncbi:MAG: glycosyltransferase [Chloroflexi bacterium]|nr:glycosyltransferase [Chloroflexota bacterium]